MNVTEANTLTNQGVDMANISPSPNAVNPSAPETNTVEGTLENGGETFSGVSEKVQWMTLFIVGLTVVSLVMNIINNKKQLERLDKEDEDFGKKIKEHDLNLRKALGNKYESLD
jgi:hypothetical protein